MTGNSDTEMHISNNSQLYSHHSTAVLAGSLLSSRSRVIFLDVDGVLLAAGSVEMCSPLPEALNWTVQQLEHTEQNFQKIFQKCMTGSTLTAWCCQCEQQKRQTLAELPSQICAQLCSSLDLRTGWTESIEQGKWASGWQQSVKHVYVFQCIDCKVFPLSFSLLWQFGVFAPSPHGSKSPLSGPVLPLLCPPNGDGERHQHIQFVQLDATWSRYLGETFWILLGSWCLISFEPSAIAIHPTGHRNYLIAKLAPTYDGPGDEGQHSEDFDDPGWEQRWSKSPLSCGRNSFGMTALVARSERSQNPSQHFLSVSLYCNQELLAWMLWLITLCRIVWC